MNSDDSLITALVHALEHDSSPKALRRAVAALRVERGLPASRAYAILVRATAGLPIEPIERVATEPAPPTVAQAQAPLLAS